MARGKQILTREQEALLARGKATYAAYREAERIIDERVEELREQLSHNSEALRVRWVQEVYAMREGKVPMKRIAEDVLEQVGTAAVYAAYREGQQLAEVGAASSAPTDTRFAREGDAIRFTPHPSDVEKIAAKIGIEGDLPESALFRVEGDVIEPVTDYQMDSGYMHPVVALVMSDGSPHERALIEFAAQG